MSAVENARGPGTGPREVSGSTPGPNIEIKLDRSKPLSKPRKKRVRASPIEILSAKRPQRIKIKKKKEKTNKQRSTHRTASATAAATRPRSKSGSGTANRSGTTQRLTKEEETILTENIRELQSLIREYDNLSAAKISSHLLPLIPNAMYKEPNMPFENKPTEEEWAEACNMSVVELRRKLEVGREARSRIVSSNIGLVLQIAKRYDSDLRRSVEGGGGNGVGTILTLNDLVQEGNLGLMEAAEKFESDKGVRFATYAAYWIKHRIIRSITNNSRVIRLPAHVHQSLRTIRKAAKEMAKEIGREPSLPELAHHLEMPLEKLQLYTDSSRSVISLQSPLSNGGSSKSGSGEEDKRTLGDKIAFDGPTPEEDAESNALKRDIRDVLDGLGNDRERDVLFLRFGLNDLEPCTLEETGKKLGISRESVRVIENRALNKLRHPQRNYRLKEYVGGLPCPPEEDTREIDLYGHSQNMGQDKTDDTLSQFRPEQIWSF